MRGLHREFLRAGADVMQAFTFYASDDKLSNRGNESSARYTVSARPLSHYSLCSERLIAKSRLLFLLIKLHCLIWISIMGVRA